MTGILILNVAFIAAAVGAIVGLLAWSIVSSMSMPAPRPTRSGQPSGKSHIEMELMGDEERLAPVLTLVQPVDARQVVDRR